MAKKPRPTKAPDEVSLPTESEGPSPKGRKRLEREIAALTATEAKLVRQLEKVRAKVAEVHRRSLNPNVEADHDSDPAADSSSSAGPLGYCMRERRTVRISDPVLITYKNGRAAVRGTCPTCGARVVALARRAAVVDA